MTISYATRAAIAALPGKTLQPWKDGDERCHCTHCDLCGELYRTVDIGTHETECQAALMKAIGSAANSKPTAEDTQAIKIGRAALLVAEARDAYIASDLPSADWLEFAKLTSATITPEIKKAIAEEAE